MIGRGLSEGRLDMNGIHAQSNEDDMNSDPNGRYSTSQFGTNASNYEATTDATYRTSSPFSGNRPAAGPQQHPPAAVATNSVDVKHAAVVNADQPAGKPASEPNSKLAAELVQFSAVAKKIRLELVPVHDFAGRCQQAFEVANDLFGHAPTWICFYRELMAGNGIIQSLFSDNSDFGDFLRTEQYHQIQLMLTALRSRDLPENDPNDPQRMITVRLPKSLHEAMCDEAVRLKISVNRLCISRMLQLLDPKMIPETNSKPRGRKPRSQARQDA